MEGRLDVMGWRGRRRDHLLDYLKEKMGRGSTRSRYVTNSVRKKQWICRKTDYGMKCASLLWCRQLSATSSPSNTQSLNYYANVSLCCDVCLLLTTTFLSVSLPWCLSVPLEPAYSCQSVSQLVSQSVYYYDVYLCVPYSHLLSTPKCSWHCRTCSRPIRNIVFLFLIGFPLKDNKILLMPIKVTYFSWTDTSTPCVLQRAEFTTEFHKASCKMGTGCFPGVKCGRGVLLTTHPLLVPRSWNSRAIPLPTLWATPGL